MDIWTALAYFQEVETARCLLRPVRMSDLNAFASIASNPENTQFIFPARENKDELRVLLAHYFIKQPLGIWAVTLKGSSDLIGVIRLENLAILHKKAEIGYFLHRDFWGQGVMTECVKTVVDLSFSNFGLEQLVIKTHVENGASARVAQKSGFKVSHSYRGSDRYTHEIRQFTDYTLTRKEWQDE